MTRGPLTTSSQEIQIRRFFPRIGRATRDAATQSRRDTQMEGGFEVFEVGRL